MNKQRQQLFVELFWCNHRYTMHTMLLGLIAVFALAASLVIGYPRGMTVAYASLFAYICSFAMHCVGVYQMCKEVEAYDDLYGEQIDF
jgi:uncharacterized membrane protein